MSRHIMIDAETWGTRPGCAIRSVGLVEFDIDAGRISEARYWNVQDTSCLSLGLVEDSGTRAYWDRQPERVKQVFLHEPKPIKTVLNDLRNVALTKPVTAFWAYGSEFDFPILSDAYDRARLPTPWKSPQLRDSRTLLETFNFDARDMPPPAEPRTAATRAIFQTQCLLACLRRIAEPVAPKRDVGSLFG